MIFSVLIIVQKVQHSRRFGHFMKQITKASQSILANNVKQFLLKKNIQIATGKMAMPEERHLFPKLRIGIYHFLYPVKVQIPNSISASLSQFFSLFLGNFLLLLSARILYAHHQPLQIIISCLYELGFF